MKPMSAKIFLDSNILIYSYSNSEPTKQTIARDLIATNISFISTQVLQELTNTVTRKFKFSYASAQNAVAECCQNNNLHINTEETILQACQIAEQSGYSFYDCMIISAAIESGCSVLYSEDMQHGQVLEPGLMIINPFI
jgi:predicted nucleic acid-binding protein